MEFSQSRPRSMVCTFCQFETDATDPVLVQEAHYISHMHTFHPKLATATIIPAGAVVYVIIKDYGYEGQSVRGVLKSEREAQLWAQGDSNYYIAVELDAMPNDDLKSVKR